MIRGVFAGVSLLGSVALGQPALTGFENRDRLLPLSESAGTNPTTVRTRTLGRVSAAGAGSFRVGQSVEFVAYERLMLAAGAEYRSGQGLTPDARIKYQLLRQEAHGVDGAVALKYKQVGFAADGGEVEGVLAASRSAGRFFANLNLVAGTALAETDLDVEGLLGAGVELGRGVVLGVNGRAQMLVGEAREEEVQRGGRPFDLLAGGLLSYRAGIFESSLLVGAHAPKGVAAPGPTGMVMLGLNL